MTKLCNSYAESMCCKFFCRLCGSYEALEGGRTSEGMEDFTGGLSEVVKLGKEAPADLFDIMLKANQRASLMCCAIEVLFYYLLGSGFRSLSF